MQRYIVLIITAVIIASISCTHFESQKEIVAAKELDSLRNIKNCLESEIDNYFKEIETIEDNLNKVEELEWVLSVQSTGENINNNVTDNINKKIDFISQILRSNAIKVDSLKNQLKKSSFNISGLEKTISRLTNKIKVQNTYIENMKSELLKRDELILQRDIAIKGLTNNIETLESENAQKNELIEEQVQTLHTAYYAFGTYKELKQQRILTSNGLFSKPKVLQKDFNKDFFLKIDIREVTEIPLYSKKIKIHTTHPKTSYSFEKKGDCYLLKILNPNQFWEISKYLVIEID
ncbi:MAG: coiled-coil domain-containing protein [Paludibacteraceae bacterium]